MTPEITIDELIARLTAFARETGEGGAVVTITATANRSYGIGAIDADGQISNALPGHTFDYISEI